MSYLITQASTHSLLAGIHDVIIIFLSLSGIQVIARKMKLTSFAGICKEVFIIYPLGGRGGG